MRAARRLFSGDSRSASFLRSLDWTTSPVGPPSGWPAEVRAAIRLCLASLQPMIVCWNGAPFANDAWARGAAIDPRAGLPPEVHTVVTRLHAEPAWIDEAPLRVGPLGLATPLLDDRDELIAIAIVDDMTPRLAHRLRAPLAPLLMTIDLLKRHAAAPADALETLEAQARLLSAAVDEIRGESRVAATSRHGGDAVGDQLVSQRGGAVLPAVGAPVSCTPLRILVVEDDDATASSLQAALSELGHTVALAHDGPVALVVAQDFQPELVLIDIGLPVVDGWNLADRLRQRGFTDLRFIAVTGRGMPEDYARSRSAGFVEHLVKPVSANELQRVIAGAAP